MTSGGVRTDPNPVHRGELGDPFVLAHEGSYYAYGTGPVDGPRVLPVLRSTDLVHWESLGGCVEPVPNGRGSTYWAPEAVYLEGRFHLYYSVGRGDADHALRVATSSQPAGPFRDVGANLTPGERFAIDPHPFVDDDGQRYLFFAKDYLDGTHVGTALAVDRLTGPASLAGEARTVLRASADWQIYLRGRTMYGSVHDWYTLEGPFVVKRHGRYHLFFSGGNWQNETYGVSWAVADHPLGPWHEPEPGGPAVLRSTPGRVGPGHNSVVVGPDGRDHLVFHAWDPSRSRRQMWIERLEWPGGRPRVASSTHD